MTSAKDLQVHPITQPVAKRFITQHHYSYKMPTKQQLYLGVFLGRRLVGAMSFGLPLFPRKALALVRDTPYNGMLELGRLAMVDGTPRNAESRVIAVACRLIRRHYPHVQWILSYADATVCGDGTIYRAAGFLLTKIVRNSSMLEHPQHGTMARVALTQKRRAIHNRGSASVDPYLADGWTVRPGFQLRYVRFLYPGQEHRLTVPVLPYDAIDQAGARMYKGRRLKDSSEPSAVQAEEGGAAPTQALQTNS